MKRAFWAGLLAIGFTTACARADEGWLTNFEKAKEQATKQNRPILVDFSGSDWCGWCIKLDKEVFSQKEFKDFAKDNLVLLLLDFPRKKALPPAEQAANEEFLKKYSVRGFPTVLILDAEGKVLGRTGYQEGGAAAYVEHLKSLLSLSKTAKE